MKKTEITDNAALIIENIRANIDERKVLLCDAFAEAVLQMAECEAYREKSAKPLIALCEYSCLLDILAEEPRE